MAKKSVYRFFPDKAALFGALVESHDILTLSHANRNEHVADEEERLSRLLTEIGDFILSPRQIMLTRLVIAEAHKAPELAERFYRECVEKTKAFIVQELYGNPRDDGNDGHEADLLTEMIVGGVLGTLHLRALMMTVDAATVRRELAQRVAVACRLLARMKAKA